MATSSPSASPTASPVASTGSPTSSPSVSPTASPVASTGAPTSSPSAFPSTKSPVASTGAPTSSPSVSPTASPVASTSAPTSSPSVSPTGAPTSSPSVSPTASPVASTGSPTSSPSASPVAPTKAPTKAPTSGAPCIERTFSNFLLKRTNRGALKIKNCKYLQRLKNQGKDITNICASTASTEKFKPAKDVCQVTCGTCSSNCVELGSATAYWITFGKKNHKTTKCEWLANKSAEAQEKACDFDESPIKKDVAKVVCPVTCKRC